MEGLCWNLGDCNRSRTFLRDQLGGLGTGGGRCLKNEAFRRSHSLSSILTPKPNDTGSLTATMALVTVAGDTLWLEWNKEVAKLVRTCGVMTVTSSFATKAWNFFHPDSYCLRVEVLWACVRSFTAAGMSCRPVKARRINAMRSSEVMSAIDATVLG